MLLAREALYLNESHLLNCNRLKRQTKTTNKLYREHSQLCIADWTTATPKSTESSLAEVAWITCWWPEVFMDEGFTQPWRKLLGSSVECINWRWQNMNWCFKKEGFFKSPKCVFILDKTCWPVCSQIQSRCTERLQKVKHSKWNNGPNGPCRPVICPCNSLFHFLC